MIRTPGGGGGAKRRLGLRGGFGTDSWCVIAYTHSFFVFPFYPFPASVEGGVG